MKIGTNKPTLASLMHATKNMWTPMVAILCFILIQQDSVRANTWNCHKAEGLVFPTSCPSDAYCCTFHTGLTTALSRCCTAGASKAWCDARTGNDITAGSCGEGIAAGISASITCHDSANVITKCEYLVAVRSAFPTWSKILLIVLLLAAICAIIYCVYRYGFRGRRIEDVAAEKAHAVKEKVKETGFIAKEKAKEAVAKAVVAVDEATPVVVREPSVVATTSYLAPTTSTYVAPTSSYVAPVVADVVTNNAGEARVTLPTSPKELKPMRSTGPARVISTGKSKDIFRKQETKEEDTQKGRVTTTTTVLGWNGSNNEISEDIHEMSN